MDPRDPGAAGLCASCVHQRLVPSARSLFSMCQRWSSDPRFPKYPPLPVIRCPGYDPQPPPDSSILDE